MTTIAFRDGILAADGRSCIGSIIASDSERKIHRLSDGALFALAGNQAFIGPMLEALEDDEDLPEVAGDEDFTAIIVETNGRLRIYQGNGGWMAMEVPFAAFGTGADLAYGAMECCASAEEAVGIAMRRDINSGGDIQVERPGHKEP